MHKPIPTCRICNSTKLETLFDLGFQALTGIFPKSENIDVPQAPLKLIKCQECDLVQLGHNYDMSLLYGDNYGYRSGLNKSMVIHLQNIVRKIRSTINLQSGDIVIDIGSNDGTLLKNYLDANVKLVGIDPCGNKFKHFYPSNINLIIDFFSKSSFQKVVPNGKAKIITSISMFYDLEEPQKFVNEVASILDDEGIWVFEQSYLPFMLNTNSFDTICHEHLEYYALKQVKQLLDKAELKIIDVDFNDVNGGSFAVFASKKTSKFAISKNVSNAFLQEEKLLLSDSSTYLQFQNRINEQKNKLWDFLKSLKERGETIIGYGASTKGNVLIQYYELTPNEIPYIAEVNEDKFNSFTPGSKIKIISEQEARAMNPDYFLVFPWHFKKFILDKEKQFLENGGKLVFPLPSLEIISAKEALMNI